jgi:hypothetical protein
MAAKLTGLTHKIAIQLHVITESCIINTSAPNSECSYTDEVFVSKIGRVYESLEHEHGRFYVHQSHLVVH